jgi:hypothetical protein
MKIFIFYYEYNHLIYEFKIESLRNLRFEIENLIFEKKKKIRLKCKEDYFKISEMSEIGKITK